MDKLDKHKSCGKCIEQFEINKSKQDGTFKEQKTKILGSRPMAKFIMYDGEGNYQKKLNQEHQNHKVQIDMTWKNTDMEVCKDKDNEELLIKESQSLVLPKIYHHKQVHDLKPNNPIPTQAHINRYGKYSQRYLLRSDPMNLSDNKLDAYLPSSEKYGRFYLSEEPKAKTIVSEVQPFEGYNPISPQYNVFPVEKPILKYHSMKSQLFKYK
ncbi:unnamed protein product (macronuclear) [Paramecium tetraurelia]|uniref:Uncharacterized protein n=1 Tax=Paramecium tetraurelia TaxID=5888 RepID=A0CMZ2_PARTE|nr:uncharacterized protein GSPATT00008600001 [Paramecium tetraurelia]CAK72159.1 unnamed protein product [Paramecium tetraurelia]|eukprot:XP_001439556.1 hypothetical protein (macronuclear) [Paramecium tetraurelia strain d4-2]